MPLTRTTLLAGTAAALTLLTGCEDEARTRVVDGCEAPAGTAPVVFTSGKRQLFGFIDLPETDGPHPLILLVPDAGRTDITRGLGDLSELRDVFRDAGIASVIWDAPGSGCSGGRYRGLADLYDRADDVLAALHAVENRDDIDASRIGAWAHGEGAWVAPMAASRDVSLRFLILVGAAGGDPIDRLSRYARANLEREGYAPQQAEELARALHDALTMMRDQGAYREYRQAVEPLSEHPLLPPMSELGGDVFTSEARYDELRTSAVLHVSPDVFLAALEIPVLAMWGEHDGQVDVEHGLAAYRDALAVAANDDGTLKVIDDADHSMCATSRDRDRAECRLADGYVETMVAWLDRYGFMSEGAMRPRGFSTGAPSVTDSDAPAPQARQ